MSSNLAGHHRKVTQKNDIGVPNLLWHIAILFGQKSEERFKPAVLKNQIAASLSDRKFN
jgi:hypothetical protein